MCSHKIIGMEANKCQIADKYANVNKNDDGGVDYTKGN